MKVQNINNTNFKAIPIANVTVKNLDKTYKLYEVTRHDKKFLNQFYEKLDLEEMMPGLKDEEYDTWSGIIKTSIDLSNKKGRKTLLETCNDVPCGLLNYIPLANKFNLNYIATFPIEKDKKVPFAGQILFNEFFKRLLDSIADKIELNALIDSPFSPISKYKKLGFKSMGGNGFVEHMKIVRNDIQDVVEKQDEFINYTKVEGKEVLLGSTKQTDSFINRTLFRLIDMF